MQHRWYSTLVAPEFLVQNDPSALSLYGNVAIWSRHTVHLMCQKFDMHFGTCSLWSMWPGLFNAPQTYFKNVVHLSNSVGPRKMMERAEFGSWSLNLTRAMRRLGFQRSPLTQTHNILFYLTDRCATDVVPYIYIFFFTSFSLQFTVLATSGFPFPVVCTIPPWLLSPSFHATCCAGRPKFSFCVFFLMPSVKVAVLNLAFPTPGHPPSAIIISLCRYNTLSEDVQPRRPSLRSLITNLFGVIERTPFVYTTFQSPLLVEIRELFN